MIFFKLILKKYFFFFFTFLYTASSFGVSPAGSEGFCEQHEPPPRKKARRSQKTSRTFETESNAVAPQHYQQKQGVESPLKQWADSSVDNEPLTTPLPLSKKSQFPEVWQKTIQRSYQPNGFFQPPNSYQAPEPILIRSSPECINLCSSDGKSSPISMNNRALFSGNVFFQPPNSYQASEPILLRPPPPYIYNASSSQQSSALGQAPVQPLAGISQTFELSPEDQAFLRSIHSTLFEGYGSPFQPAQPMEERSSEVVEAFAHEPLPSKYAHLKELNLSAAILTFFQAEYAYANLKSLNLSKNQLTFFIMNFSAPFLESIDLSNNKIESLHFSESFPRLKTLNISGNRMRCCFMNVTFPSLENLDLSANKLQKVIFEKQPKVIFLNLANNQLAFIELKASSFPSLAKLNLFNNELTHLDNIESLLFVSELDLSKNFFKTIPSFSKFPSLNILKFSNNKRIQKISEEQLAELGRGLQNTTEVWLDGYPSLKGAIEVAKKKMNCRDFCFSTDGNTLLNASPSGKLQPRNSAYMSEEMYAILLKDLSTTEDVSFDGIPL